MALGTTTWKYRNVDRLLELKEEAKRRSMKTPSVVIVGPGGIVEFLAELFPHGDKASWSFATRLTKFFTHQIESVLRKTGCFKLKCFEVSEVLETLAELRLGIVSVLDSEDRVLETVRSDLRERVSTILADIVSDKPPVSGDMVVCYNAIERTGDHMRALQNLTRITKPDGLLSLVMSRRVRVSPEDLGLKKLSPTLFAKDRIRN